MPVNYTWVKCNRDLSGLYLFDYDESTTAEISYDLEESEVRKISMIPILKKNSIYVKFEKLAA